MCIAILLLVSRVGDREYALQCHGQGFNILDATDPASIFRVQFVAMSGGGYWLYVATHTDSVSGKTYASTLEARVLKVEGFHPIYSYWI